MRILPWRSGVKNVRRAPAVCHDIAAWCAQHPRAHYQTIDPPATVRRALPKTIETQVDTSFNSLLQVVAPPRALVSVPRAQVWGKSALVALPDGSIVGELIAVTPHGREQMLAAEPSFVHPPQQIRRLRGCWYPLSVIGWYNYYHWNHDVISRLRNVLPTLPGECKFLVPGGIRPFQHETLRMLGITTERVEYLDEAGVECQELCFSPPVQKTQFDTPEPFEWFREQSRRYCGLQSGTARRRILLSREGDVHYRTVNQAEVSALLESFGFETVHPGTLSFCEQVQLFSGAEVIAGTGTGLFNMVFAPRGAHILQFQEPTKFVHALWTLSEALGHEYWYMLAEPVPGPDPVLPNILVPLDKLTAVINAMLPGRHG